MLQADDQIFEASVATPPAAGGAGGLGADELAELVRVFSEASAGLEVAHRALQGEVGRLQEELRETRSQLDRARELAALGEMAAGIAHEVRNPLGSIRLYAQALVSDLGDRPAECDVAGKIVRSVDRLNAVVGDVLAFSREMRIEGEAVDVSVFLTESLDGIIESMAERGVRVDVDHAGAVGELALMDGSLAAQALLNIVRNACDAAGECGEREARVCVGVARSRWRTADGDSREMVGVRVEDSGEGIPEDVRKRVFNPFFTTRETGTGLGLAIVHRIMDASGGRVVIEDSPSSLGGAAVRLEWPRPGCDGAGQQEVVCADRTRR